MKKSRLGQSTMEYVIIFSILVGIIIVAIGAIRGNIGGAVSDLTGKIQAGLAE